LRQDHLGDPIGRRTHGKSMNFEDARKAMKSCEAFQGFKDEELGLLMMAAKSRRVADRDLLYKKGDPRTTTFCLIASGVLEVLGGEELDAPVAGVESEVYSGAIVGEIGQVNPKGTRTRTLRAKGETWLLEWDFALLKDRAPKIAERLAQRFEQLAFERLSQQGLQNT
jgi:hypothetical protein